MIGKTFTTIRNNPRVLLVFGAAFVFMSFGLSALTLLMLGSAEGPVFLDYDVINSLLRHFLGYMGVLLLFLLLATSLVWSALGNYIYEMCSGKLGKGWYLRGLRKNWWKVPLAAVIIAAIGIVVLLVVGFMFNYVFRTALVSGLINIIMTLVLATYSIILITAIFAEKEFSYSLGNVFSLGSNYFFKLLGVMLLAYLPGFLGSLLFTYIRGAVGIVIDGFSFLYFMTLIINAAYSALVSVFILTYGMHRYLDERSIYYPPVPSEEKAGDIPVITK